MSQTRWVSCGPVHTSLLWGGDVQDKFVLVRAGPVTTQNLLRFFCNSSRMIVFQCLAYNWTWYPVFLYFGKSVLLGLLQVSLISRGQLFDCWQMVQVQLQRLHRDLPALFDFIICFGLQGDLKGNKNQFFEDFLALENSSTILKGVLLKKTHHIVTWVVKKRDACGGHTN